MKPNTLDKNCFLRQHAFESPLLRCGRSVAGVQRAPFLIFYQLEPFDC